MHTLVYLVCSIIVFKKVKRCKTAISVVIVLLAFGTLWVAVMVNSTTDAHIFPVAGPAAFSLFLLPMTQNKLDKQKHPYNPCV